MKQEDVDNIFNTVSPHYLKDAEKIQSVIKNAFNVDVSLPNVVVFWKHHSDEWCAGWIGIESEQEVVEAFKEFCNKHIGV